MGERVIDLAREERLVELDVAAPGIDQRQHLAIDRRRKVGGEARPV